MFQWSTVRLVRRILLLCLVLYLGAWAYRIVTRKYYIWLPGYVSWLFHQERPAGTPVLVASGKPQLLGAAAQLRAVGGGVGGPG